MLKATLMICLMISLKTKKNNYFVDFQSFVEFFINNGLMILYFMLNIQMTFVVKLFPYLLFNKTFDKSNEFLINLTITF